MYTSYQCTVCRKKTDILVDSSHVFPEKCMITNGCVGSLVKIGNSLSAKNAVIYPASDYSPSSIESGDALYLISYNNFLSFAFDFGTEVFDPGKTTLVANFSQLSITGDAPNTFTFKPETATRTIAGKDVFGKILRFDDAAIESKRVNVKINGVDAAQELVLLTPNNVSFTTDINSGDTVSVLVYKSNSFAKHTTDLTANYIRSFSFSPWGNVTRCSYRNELSQERMLWVYTSEAISFPANTYLKLESISIYGLNNSEIDLSDSYILLSSFPYTNHDRIRNVVVPLSTLSKNFIIRSDREGKMRISREFIHDLYPPIRVVKEHLSSDDSDVVLSSSQTDEPNIISSLTYGPL